MYNNPKNQDLFQDRSGFSGLLQKERTHFIKEFPLETDLDVSSHSRAENSLYRQIDAIP